ncbi:hypothetical protein ABFX02_06G008400 [Erythranthe guttata]
MSAKSKSALSGKPSTKASPATPQAGKPSRGVVKPVATSTSSPQNGGLSVDRSSKPVALKTTINRLSPKISTPPDKKTTSTLKPSELQAELNLAQEDLKKANDKLVLVEKEKAEALDEVKEAQRLSDEANENLRKALAAQKLAEENSEIEKFRAVEIEQAGVEAAQKKEEEWRKDLEAVRNEHTVDVSALLSATLELQKLKQELAMTCDAKNQALSHADEATKLAEIHVDKVKALASEMAHLKSVLDSRIEMEAIENNKLVSDLKSEIDTLREELQKVKILEEKLAEKEANLEQLSVDVEAAKIAEFYACKLVEEFHGRVEELKSQAEEANRLEKSASESLESVMQQLGKSKELLRDAEFEILSLKENVSLLEISNGKQKRDLEESVRCFELAKEEASQMAKKVEFLESEIENVGEEKTKALANEKLATAGARTLLDEKNKLVNELEISREEEEKSKKALESLASALHEVSTEARDAKEKLISIQLERENYETQIEDLRLVLKATTEKYESMLDDAKQDIDALTNSIQHSNQDYDNLKAEFDQKELHLMDAVKKSEEEKSGLETEISRLIDLLQVTEEKACAIKEEGDNWKKSFKEADSEVIHLKEVLDEVKSESMRLKEDSIDRENELKKIILENEELRKRETDSSIKVEVLTKQLEEALAKKKGEENLDLTDSEKEYDVLPKWTSFMKEKPSEFRVKNSNGKLKEKGSGNSAEVLDLEMWESCKIDEKDLSIEDEVESKTTEGSADLENGGTSPSKSSSEKKKKPLLQKFGSLLKKKSTTNQK